MFMSFNRPSLIFFFVFEIGDRQQPTFTGQTLEQLDSPYLAKQESVLFYFLNLED